MSLGRKEIGWDWKEMASFGLYIYTLTLWIPQSALGDTLKHAHVYTNINEER